MNKARLIGCSLPPVIAGAAAFSVMVATVAFAATGDVTPAGCVSDLGSSECTHTTEGLNHPYDIAISPDGTSVYVAALDDDALVMFTRTSTGQIFPAGCIADDQGPDICDGKMAPGLNGARSVVVSPRGDMVYVVGADDATIDRFSRDLSTGQLTFEECIQDTEVEISQHDCTVTSDGLEGARQVAISPDGNSAYVASLTDDAIAEFETSGGTLSSLGCIDDNDTGKDPCKPSVDGLYEAHSVTVSPDGISVYAASFGDNAVVKFARSTATGLLKPKGCIEDDNHHPDTCLQLAPGLTGARQVSVSPDGKSVYVAGTLDNDVSFFARSVTGALSFKYCVDDIGSPAEVCKKSAYGLSGAHAVVVSPDGKSVYAAGQDDHALVVFRRSVTGDLAGRGCVRDDDLGTDPCSQTAHGYGRAHEIAVSSDGISVYVAAGDDDAVARLIRQP